MTGNKSVSAGTQKLLVVLQYYKMYEVMKEKCEKFACQECGKEFSFKNCLKCHLLSLIDNQKLHL